VRDLAIPMPVRVVLERLGLEDSQWPEFAQWSQVLMSSGGGPRYINDAVIEAAVEYGQRATLQFEKRRAEPREDWISMMLAHADEGLTRRELPDMISESLLLLNGGSDTTRHVIAGGTLALLQHPDQMERLRREPERLPRAIEEMIRWVSPLLNMRRTATRDTELAGTAIAKGDQLLLMYASANRDQTIFDEPGRFDIERSPNPHLAFGIGTHFCLGANLARMELRVMFEEILSRLHGMRIVDGFEPKLSSTGFARGLVSLPVTFEPK
jgi:cytochrome P450 family 142 subfamily A polypeptide 1